MRAAQSNLALRSWFCLLSTINSQPSTNDVLVVLTTWPDADKARTAVLQLVEEKLVACANLVPGIESIYRWQGKIEASSEVLVIFKTTSARYAVLESRIRALHRYDVPEVVAIPVTKGLPDYLHWIEKSCRR